MNNKKFLKSGIVKMTIELFIFLTEFKVIKIKKDHLNFKALKKLRKTESQKI